MQLNGIGPMSHSKYSNTVFLGWWNDYLVVYGVEWGGKYIEIIEPKSGEIVGNKILDHHSWRRDSLIPAVMNKLERKKSRQ